MILIDLKQIIVQGTFSDLIQTNPNCFSLGELILKWTSSVVTFQECRFLSIGFMINKYTIMSPDEISGKASV